jgi:glycosyltransferase involved in cell wall biosynthesis
MRVLILSKRQYTGRDLLDDRYGRVFELPAALARRGHTIRGVALSYRRRRECEYRWADIDRLTWYSVNLGPFGSGLCRYMSELHRAALEFNPDVVWATSDSYHGMMGGWFSRRYGSPLVVDFYDNYESFGASRVPGVVASLRAASRRAAAVTVVSSTLAERMGRRYRLSQSPYVIGNGVDTRIFCPRDRSVARRQLGLPEEARIMGVVGTLARSRGIADVFEAFLHLAESHPKLWFVFAGERDQTPARYKHPRIRDMGILAPFDVPVLLSSLDVAVVSNIDSAFGRYCYPQKLMESIACGIPLVAAGVGEVARILAENPHALYRPGDSASLADAIRRMLVDPRPVSIPVADWHERGGQLESVLSKQLR